MISYYSEDTDFVLGGKRLNSAWLKAVCTSESRRAGDISIIFCSDAYLLDINRQYLKHDYYTDIITFDYCEGERVSGDLFISVDSVRDNAAHFGTTFENELDRVMVHGVLHLIGYDDHSEDDIKVMRSKEDHYIGLKGSMAG